MIQKVILAVNLIFMGKAFLQLVVIYNEMQDRKYSKISLNVAGILLFM